MRRTRLALLSLLTLALLLIGPTLAYGNGSQPIPPVTPWVHPTLGPGLFFPEAAAKHNDALTEAAISKAALYEQRLGEVSMQLDIAEAQLAVAKDSLQNLRDLVPRVKDEAYKAGFGTGRHGLGAYVGYSLIDNNFAAGFGYVVRF